MIASRLRLRPAHDRNGADAVFRAAFDDPVAVRHVDQHVALLVEEAHNLQVLNNMLGRSSKTRSPSLISPLILIGPIWRHAMLESLVSSATPKAPFIPPV